MPKQSRLTREDFSSLSKNRPKTYFGRFFTLAVYPADQNTKVACVVAKKNVRHATDRNTVKRRVREVVRALLPALPAGSYVIYTKKKANEATFADIQSDIQDLLKQANALG